MKAVLRTFHNGDEWSIELESGEKFTRFFDNSGEGPVFYKERLSLDGSGRTTVSIEGVNHDLFWEWVHTLEKVSSGGGNPYPRSPHWASDFRASYQGDMDQELERQLRRTEILLGFIRSYFEPVSFGGFISWVPKGVMEPRKLVWAFLRKDATYAELRKEFEP